jgi:hypothetical protein
MDDKRKLPTDLVDSEAECEVQKSKVQLSERILSDVYGFCYPREQYRQSHADMVRRAGYAYAVTTRFDGNPAEADPFVLCRRNMSDYQGLRRLFPVAMHRLALAGRMDRCIAMRRTG